MRQILFSHIFQENLLMRGVILDRESFDRNDLDLSPIYSTLGSHTEFDATAPELVATRLQGCQTVVTNKVPIGREVFEASPEVRLIAVAATGTNNIDLPAARDHGVTVCNVTGYATPSVVQHVFALLLALTRNIPAYAAEVRSGAWQRSEHFCLLDWPIGELHGRTLGIIGYGELGRAVARTAESAFGMNVLIAERAHRTPHSGRLPLEQLLPLVDVLSLHCPLSPETKGLIGARELALMKRGALLVNTARGGIVDESALAEALRTNHLGGAGVDVLSTEPPKPDNPLLALEVPNLIITPHVAWASRNSRQKLVNGIGDIIRAFLNGSPSNVVMPS